MLDYTRTSMAEFVALMGQGKQDPPYSRRIPVIGHAQAGRAGFFDDGGFPVGHGWERLSFPDIDDPNAYALEISGDSMEPLYRDGDYIVVAPNQSVRKGDRVVCRTTEGEVMVKALERRTATRVELSSFHPEHEDRVLAPEEIDWLARIVWASQ